MTTDDVIRRDATRVVAKCAVCGRKDVATRITVELRPLVSYAWTQIPAGWWRHEGPDLHLRCPKCLSVPEESS